MSTQVPPPPPDSDEEIDDPSPRVRREKNVSWSLDDSAPPERIASSTQGSPWLRDPGSRRDVEAYWATLRDASAHGHAAGNAAARDVHGKAGFVLALCDAFRRVDESRE